MTNPKTFFPLLFWVLLLSLTLSACQSNSQPPVTTPEVEQADSFSPVVSSTGVVVPSQWSDLSASNAGLIAEILLEEGNSVSTGEALIRLKGKEDLQAAVVAAEMEVLSAQQAIKDLNDQTATLRAEALQRVGAANQAVRDAQFQLDNFTVPTRQKEMEALEAVEAMRTRLDEARQAFEQVKVRSINDSIRRERKETLDEAQSDYNAAVRRLSLEVALDSAQASLDEALKDMQALKDGPDPDQLRLAEARLANARAAQSAAQSALQDLEFRAPFEGTITRIHVRQGEWVSPGQPILVLADLNHLQVETTDLNEIDVARIQIGDAARVTFDAIPDLAVEGTVAQIALKSSEGSGVNYTVIIEMDEVPVALRWGMTAFVDITVK